MRLIWRSGQSMEIRFGFPIENAIKDGERAWDVLISVRELTQGLNALGPYKLEEYLLKMERMLDTPIKKER